MLIKQIIFAQKEGEINSAEVWYYILVCTLFQFVKVLKILVLKSVLTRLVKTAGKMTNVIS